MHSAHLSGFVGREAELAELQALIGGVLAGHGAVGFVVGEAGIGKTALCRQMREYAGAEGARWLVGQCDETSELSLPYLAFIEALRGLLTGDDTRLMSGPGTSEVARLVPDPVSGWARNPSPSDPADAVTARHRMLRGVVDFLRAETAATPIVLVLEDLHNADAGTLELLRHVARHVAELRLLVMGTYRDSDVGPSHPLSRTLGELRPRTSLHRIRLGGLPPGMVRRLAEGIAGQPVPPDLADGIYRQSEGNPLFVEEIVRGLIAEGFAATPASSEGLSAAPPTALTFVPDGLRHDRLAQIVRLGRRVKPVDCWSVPWRYTRSRSLTTSVDGASSCFFSGER